ncbi:uncharacterized protein LOC108917324 [Anoplophora glabripennis]|uniref:uncharacterized protein LOC108917324 n=1 Tax=Anoplophora glabripennis TaxID=217634 RepID=UPI0008736217|nr:uncharacterized protein LOC108917324 [Anoplophora glabripennis]
MLRYLIIILLSSTTSSIKADLDFEESLKEYIPIYKRRAENYSRCNMFFKSSSAVSKNMANWFASQNGCGNIIISNVLDYKFAVTDSHANFHFFESVQHVKGNLLKLPETFLFNGKGDSHFIIGTKTKDFKFLLDTFEFFWKKRFINCVIVFVYEHLEIFAYDTFRQVALNLTACDRCPLFSRVLRNFWGYPLRVNMFEEYPLLRKVDDRWMGKDYGIMMEIAKRSNVSLQILDTSGGFGGTMESLIRNESDICFVSMFLLTKYKMKGIDYVYPEHINSIVLLVPRSPKIPQYKKLIYIFDKNVWICLSITILGVALVVKIIATCNNRRNTYFYYLLVVWRSFLQQGVCSSRQRYHKARPFLVLWLYFSLIFGTAFQTSLMSMFIKSKYWKDINTLSEVRQLGLPIYVPAVYGDVIPKRYKLHKQLKFVEGMNQLHDLISTSNTFSGYIMTEEAARVYVEFIRSKDDKPIYHIVGEKLIPGINTYMVQKKSPFLKRINKMMLLIRQFGLRDHWMKNSPVINMNWRKRVCGVASQVT